MMIKKFSIVAIFAILITSCVSPKVYKELEDKYSNLKDEYSNLEEENDALTLAKNQLQNDLDALQKQYDEAVAQRDKLQADYSAIKANHDNLKNSYDALEANSSAAIAENVNKNRELLAKLEAKEQALAEESERLKKLEKDLAERSNEIAALQSDLEKRSNRVAELENLIAAKDKAMNDLKDAISRALTDFEGKGLTVEQRDGKVYVSMENKLLFKSGSWAVGAEGRRAVEQLGTVLADNPEINVLIEGHTDNVPYKGNAQLSGNWDLSTKRATAIVKILQENAQIKTENLTAAGRGEYAPIESNDTAEGRAKNRRIEVILTPKLDEISKLLNDI